jgi:hypothetical protein
MWSVPEYAVDVVIPVHSRERPVERAAASVLDGTSAPVRVTVVAHNIDPGVIRDRLGALADDPRLRLLELRDGIPSPAGPMNLGFARATAPFVALLGSDDEFAPGAIDSWLALQRETGADAVLARIRLANGGTDPYPPVRGGRRARRLDGERDRLAYRSAPLGIVSRERFPGLRLTEGLGSGEDLAYSLTVWFTGRDLAYDLRGPAYVVNGDASDRVTSAARPLEQDFAFLDAIERLPWFATAAPAARRAIVVKLFRIHFFDALRVRLGSDDGLRANRDGFVGLAERLEGLAPGSIRLLSAADRRVLDALRAPATGAARLRELVSARQRFPAPSTMAPRNPLLALHRQAPFRTLLAGALVMRSSDARA